MAWLLVGIIQGDLLGHLTGYSPTQTVLKILGMKREDFLSVGCIKFKWIVICVSEVSVFNCLVALFNVLHDLVSFKGQDWQLLLNQCFFQGGGLTGGITPKTKSITPPVKSSKFCNTKDSFITLLELHPLSCFTPSKDLNNPRAFFLKDTLF